VVAVRVCFVGLDNLPALSGNFAQHVMGGESVQQSLLARALARSGDDVSMVVADHGQNDGAEWHGVRTFKAFHPDAGWPIVRFVHPRWTGLWSALRRADADLYYTSCAGMHVGLLALFCRSHGRRFVFRCASDSDCDPSGLLVRYARDRWLYRLGLRRADAIFVQSEAQYEALARNYGVPSQVAGMLVERATHSAPRDIDVLWVGNIRRVKRPERVLTLAEQLPALRFHMVGGQMPDERQLGRDIERHSIAHANLAFHGRLPYVDTNDLYDRARLLLNTSDVEGFPNSYLQAWIRGVPVVTLRDPDGVIAREGLGRAVASPGALRTAVEELLGDEAELRAASERCRRYMAREYAEDRIVNVYRETFAEVLAA